MKSQKQNKILIVGLTGSIGMGKSTVANLFKKFGFPVHNADKAVHNLLQNGGEAEAVIKKLFPCSIKNNKISRKLLGQIVFQNPPSLKKLEKILHPLVRQKQNEAIANATQKGAAAIILEIPLLFETGADKLCNYVICVSCNAKTQKERIMRRPAMTPDKCKAIIKAQMKNTYKKKRSHFIIKTDIPLPDTKIAVKKLATYFKGLHNA